MKSGRVLKVVAIVAGLGAAAGALTTTLVVLLMELLDGRPVRLGMIAQLAAFAALYGAVFGGVLGPLAAFGFLRKVPLWRAILGTGIGTVLGLGAVFVFSAHPFGAPLLGFGLGALAARLDQARRDRAALSSGGADPPRLSSD